jgi:hypothetical protein
VFNHFRWCSGANVAPALARNMVSATAPIHIKGPIIFRQTFANSFVKLGQIGVTERAL